MRNLQIKGQNSHKLKLLIFVFSNRAISLSIAFGRRKCIGRMHLPSDTICEYGHIVGSVCEMQ